MRDGRSVAASVPAILKYSRKVVRFKIMANIFLLEDDKVLSKGISIALKKDEHTITAVYGYLEALQQYQKQKYDLFLLDINLPDGSGLEFCKKIRETAETPVLFLTANDYFRFVMFIILFCCKITQKAPQCSYCEAQSSLLKSSVSLSF